MPAAAKSQKNVHASHISSNQIERHQHSSDLPVTQIQKNPFFSSAEKKGSFFQPKLIVNRIDDPYETEADRVAEEVTQSIYSKGEGAFFPPSPLVNGDGGTGVQTNAFFQRKPAFESPTEMDLNTAAHEAVQRSTDDTAKTRILPPAPIQRQDEEVLESEEDHVQRQATPINIADSPEASTEFEQRLRSSKGGGKSLTGKTRDQMESAFKADFSNVRIHDDSNAETMSNNVFAHAFTHGSDIYFNQGTYRPDTKEGTTLLAHELTHVVQQGGAGQGSVQRSTGINITQSAPPMVQRGIISRARNWAADKAANIPGYTMLTVILGFNPINGADVARNATNIFRAIMGFMPGGDLIWQALNNYGIFDKVGTWLVQKFEELRDIGASIISAFREFLNSLGITDIARLGSLWRRAKRIFTNPIKRIISFVKSLVKDILIFIRDAILKPLAALAEGTPAWDLLLAVLGVNPITGESVPRTADTLIGGFMKLIGQEEIWENMKRANAVARGWAWFQSTISQLIAMVSSLPGKFINTLKSLTITDLVLAPRAFAKIIKVFATFAIDFASWAGNAMWELLKIIFAVVAPGAMPFLNRAGAAFKSILENPMDFLGNLVQAGKMGFNMFKENIGSILKDVLIDWLTGTLEGAGIYIPQALEFKEIVKFILSVLGLTWDNIRAKLVEHLGEGPVVVLEEGFELVKTLITEGPGAAWEQIKEHLSNLKEMVIGEIISWVTQTVVAKAVVKIVSSLNPVGGFIQAILTIWGVIKVFIQRIRKIIEVGVAFLNSIVEIAEGNLMPAAQKIVNTMKGILVLAVSFLAEFAGLGKIGQALQNILKKIRDPIDKAMDKVILWIKNKAKSFLKGKDDEKHAQIATAAGEEMKQGGENLGSYEELRKNKEVQAKNIEDKYKGQLKQGIGIRVAFTAPESDKTDEDLDFTIIIAPNTTKKKGSVKVKSGITDIKVKRSTFRLTTKWELFERDEDSEHHGSLTEQEAEDRKKKRRSPRLKKNLDRRHVISSQTMAAHYESVLNGKKWSKAKDILDPKKPVAEPLDNDNIQKSAQALHRDFFNDVENLFIGDASENRSIGAETDIPEAWVDRKSKMWKKHLKYIKDNYALDSSFTA